MKRYIKVSIIGILFIAIVSYFYIDRALALYFASNPCCIKSFLSSFSDFGLSEYYLIPSLLIAVIFYKSKDYISKRAFYIFATTALSGIIVIVIKVIFARYRPPKFINEELYGFNWFDFGYIINSFPSGHSATAFSVYVALSLLIPKFKWFFLIFATLIALSRVALGVHYLSDVLIGSLIGATISLFLYRLFFGERA